MTPRPKKIRGPFYQLPFTTRHTWHEGYKKDLDEAVEMMEQNRNLDCDHYEECLDVVANANWPGWSCVGCPFFGGRSDLLLLPEAGKDDAVPLGPIGLL
jgi:hypothetical protein